MRNKDFTTISIRRDYYNKLKNISKAEKFSTVSVLDDILRHKIELPDHFLRNELKKLRISSKVCIHSLVSRMQDTQRELKKIIASCNYIIKMTDNTINYEEYEYKNKNSFTGRLT